MNGLVMSLARLLAKLSVPKCSDRCPGVLLQPAQRMSSFQPIFCQLFLCFYVILSNCLVSKQNYRVKEHIIRNKTLRVCRRGGKGRNLKAKGKGRKKWKGESRYRASVIATLVVCWISQEDSKNSFPSCLNQGFGCSK